MTDPTNQELRDLPDDLMLSTENTATFLKVSRRTFDKMIASDRCPPFVLIGSRRFFAAGDVRQWLREKRRRSVAITRHLAA